jgi:hypothetical protein
VADDGDDLHVWSLTLDASPLIHMPFCRDNALLAGFSGSFAQDLLSALAGRHDDGDVISLTRRAVNNPNSSQGYGVRESAVAKKGGFLRRGL